MPRLATRCLCLLSTWLVVCLVPCAPMSIVCPLPSCYVIIVSVAPAVSPSLPSFVSLYSSPCVCSPVLIRCLSCVLRHVSFLCLMFDCAPVFCLPACLFFPFGVVYVLLFNFVIKTLKISAFESSTSSLLTSLHFKFSHISLYIQLSICILLFLIYLFHFLLSMFMFCHCQSVALWKLLSRKQIPRMCKHTYNKANSDSIFSRNIT